MKKTITTILLISFGITQIAYSDDNWFDDNIEIIFASGIFLTAAAYTIFKILPGKSHTSRVKDDAIDQIIYICTDNQMQELKSLKKADEIEYFLRLFWSEIDPEFKASHLERINYANEHFREGKSGVRSDRGRAYILYGPPDDIDYESSMKLGFTPQMSSILDIEIWYYFRTAEREIPSIFTGISRGGLFFIFGDYGDGSLKQVYSSGRDEKYDPRIQF